MLSAWSGSIVSVQDFERQDLRYVPFTRWWDICPTLLAYPPEVAQANRQLPDLIRRIKTGKPRNHNTYVKDAGKFFDHHK